MIALRSILVLALNFIISISAQTQGGFVNGKISSIEQELNKSEKEIQYYDNGNVYYKYTGITREPTTGLDVSYEAYDFDINEKGIDAVHLFVPIGRFSKNLQLLLGYLQCSTNLDCKVNIQPSFITYKWVYENGLIAAIETERAPSSVPYHKRTFTLNFIRP